MRARSVAVICNCAVYRDSGLTSRSDTRRIGATLEEDLWVPHVHILAAKGTTIAAQKELYAIFDVGEGIPCRESNKKLLMSINPCGFAGSENSGPTSILAAHADEWIQHVRNGDSDIALAAIESLPETLNSYKPRLKAQILFQAARYSEAAEIVRSIRTASESLDPAVQAQFARFAVAGGDLALARELLIACLPELTSQESIEQALSVTVSLGAMDIEEECLRRLEASYPASHALRRRRVWHFLCRSEALARRDAPAENTARKPIDVVELQQAFEAAV